jgi:hypothetical protein
MFCNKLTEIASDESLKRQEENYKFIFKRCLKKMKDEFRNQTNSKFKKKDFEREFYRHYFNEQVEKYNLPLDSFFHPKNSKRNSEFAQKTINNNYVDNISRSEKFVQQFQKCLNEILEKEYRNEIDSKIHALIQKWEIDLLNTTANDKTKVVGQICTYITKNKKCKLPWTINEVKEAIHSVRKLFETQTKPK